MFMEQLTAREAKSIELAGSTGHVSTTILHFIRLLTSVVPHSPVSTRNSSSTMFPLQCLLCSGKSIFGL